MLRGFKLQTLANVIFYLALAYIAICILLFAIQNSFVFFPTSSNNILVVPVEEYEIPGESPGSTTLHGYIANPEITHGPVVLFFTGNAGDARSYVNGLAPLEAPVVFVDYPGYGKNNGRPSEKSILANANIAIEWTRERFPDRPLFLMGSSLGSGVATLSSDESVSGLILVSPYRSLVHVANRSIFRIFPLRLLMRNKFDTRSRLDRLPSSVFVLYSEIDTTIPFQETLEVLDRIPHSKVVVDRVHHNELLGNSANIRSIQEWLSHQNELGSKNAQ